MLSFGIEYERAFSIAFWSARLPPGSAPPSLAATMIARESLEKSLPRLASAAPFLCLMLDHLLCPDNCRLPCQLEKPLVNSRVVGQFGVERRHEDPAVAEQHRLAVELREDLDIRPVCQHERREYEDAPTRPRVARITSPRSGRSSASSSRSASKLATCRPYAVRSTSMSVSARCARSRTIMPAHVPRIAPSKRRIASSSP